MKKLFLFAGVNGAGKSTLYTDVLIDPDIKNSYRINADEIARKKGWDWREAATDRKAFLVEIKELSRAIKSGKDINLETTFAGRINSITRLLNRIKSNNYKIFLYYVGVSNYELAIKRVHERVKKGGHGIADDLVKRRYFESMNNLKEMINYFDEVNIFDNTVNFRRVYKRTGAKVFYKSKNLPDWAREAVENDTNCGTIR